MCVRKYIEGIVRDYIKSHPHPVADHTHENYVDMNNVGHVFLQSNEKIEWGMICSGNSTTILIDIKTSV